MRSLIIVTPTIDAMTVHEIERRVRVEQFRRKNARMRRSSSRAASWAVLWSRASFDLGQWARAGRIDTTMPVAVVTVGVSQKRLEQLHRRARRHCGAALCRFDDEEYARENAL